MQTFLLNALMCWKRGGFSFEKIYMLDTNICSYIMRERPESVLIELQARVQNRDRIVISAITYVELGFGAIGKKSSPRHNVIVDEYMARIGRVHILSAASIDRFTIGDPDNVYHKL